MKKACLSFSFFISTWPIVIQGMNYNDHNKEDLWNRFTAIYQKIPVNKKVLETCGAGAGVTLAYLTGSQWLLLGIVAYKLFLGNENELENKIDILSTKVNSNQEELLDKIGTLESTWEQHWQENVNTQKTLLLSQNQGFEDITQKIENTKSSLTQQLAILDEKNVEKFDILKAEISILNQNVLQYNQNVLLYHQEMLSMFNEVRTQNNETRILQQETSKKFDKLAHICLLFAQLKGEAKEDSRKQSLNLPQVISNNQTTTTESSPNNASTLRKTFWNLFLHQPDL